MTDKKKKEFSPWVMVTKPVCSNKDRQRVRVTKPVSLIVKGPRSLKPNYLTINRNGLHNLITISQFKFRCLGIWTFRHLVKREV